MYRPTYSRGRERAYYLHSVLHCTTGLDSKCREILSNLKPALTKGYGKLLINEVVIPNTKARRL